MKGLAGHTERRASDLKVPMSSSSRGSHRSLLALSGRETVLAASISWALKSRYRVPCTFSLHGHPEDRVVIICILEMRWPRISPEAPTESEAELAPQPCSSP